LPRLAQNLLYSAPPDAKSLGFYWPRSIWFIHDPSLNRRSSPITEDFIWPAPPRFSPEALKSLIKGYYSVRKPCAVQAPCC
jgi:hypothetical protein